MPDIQSRHNPKIKLLRALQRRSGRQRYGLCAVEGLRHIGAALEANAEIAFLLWAPERLDSPFGRELVTTAQARGIPVLTTSAHLLDGVSGREHSQGMIAVVQRPSFSLESLNPHQHPWLVAVHQPQSPGNIGALLRTMDAVDASALLLLDGGVDPCAPEAIRASMGALFWLPVVSTSGDEFLPWARQQGYHLYGSSAHGTADYRAVGYTKPLTLLLGNERHGLLPLYREACEAVVSLPMEGHGSSLNLAVAAGVLLYTIRERLQPSPRRQ